MRTGLLLIIFSLSALLTSCGSNSAREGEYAIPVKQQLRDAERRLEKSLEKSIAISNETKNSDIEKEPTQKFQLETQIVFPVVGKHRFSNDFGNPREGHTHKGNDILSPKMLPVVAVADGVVSWLYRKGSGKCCYLAIDHEGDWQSRYIHLNNDSEGTDDGQGDGIVEGLEEGSIVKAGQLIGWVGDSGNAEKTTPHVHFEILVQGEYVNPYPYLKAAKQLDRPILE